MNRFGEEQLLTAPFFITDGITDEEDYWITQMDQRAGMARMEVTVCIDLEQPKSW
jgi:hypothetical protein